MKFSQIIAARSPALGVALLLASQAAALEIRHFQVPLSGDQMVPPVATAGTGTCLVALDDVTGALTVSGSFSGLSSNATSASLNGPAASGVNAGILVTLTENGGTSGGVSGGGALSPTNVANMLDGLTYLVVRTVNHPAGEIRGQVAAFTGEMLFKGIFLGQGAVASLLPEYWPQTPASLPPGVSTRAGMAAEIQNVEAALQASGMTGAAQNAADLAAMALDTNVPFDLTGHGLSAARIQALMSAIHASDGTFFTRFGQDVQSGNPVQVRAALREGGEMLMERVDLQPSSGFIDVWYYFDLVVAIEVALVAILVLVAVLAVQGPGGALDFDGASLLISDRFGSPITVPTTTQAAFLVLVLGALVIGSALLYARSRRPSAC